MLTFLSTVFSSILSGGATGLLGVVLQRIADYKNRQLDLQLEAQKQTHELALRDKDAQIMREEWAARTQVAQVEGAAKEAVADAATLAESYKMEPQRFSEGVKYSHGQGWVMVLLDAARGIVRPLLTVYLCALTTYVYYQVQTKLAGPVLSQGEALELAKMVIGTVLYLTTTCVLWWFGTRNKAQPPKAG